MHRGFIKIWRKIEDWEWFNQPEMFWFFTKLILMANWEDKQWQGITIKRGQLVTSIEALRFPYRTVFGRKNVKMSVQNVRSLLKRLNLTGEITIETNNRYTLISIVNYNLYHDISLDVTSKPTDDQQMTNKRLTTTKEVKRIKEYNNIGHPYLENPAFKNAFEQFLKMRERIKKPATPYAQSLLLKKLGEESVEVATAMLEQSILGSWQGVFPLKNNGAAEENNRGR